jgi:hypothetical protein
LFLNNFLKISICISFVGIFLGDEEAASTALIAMETSPIAAEIGTPISNQIIPYAVPTPPNTAQLATLSTPKAATTHANAAPVIMKTTPNIVSSPMHSASKAMETNPKTVPTQLYTAPIVKPTNRDPTVLQTAPQFALSHTQAAPVPMQTEPDSFLAPTYAPQIANQTAPNPAPPQMHTLPISMQTAPKITANCTHTALIAANTAPHNFLTTAVSPPVTKYTKRIVPTPTHTTPPGLTAPIAIQPFAKTLTQAASISVKDAPQVASMYHTEQKAKACESNHKFGPAKDDDHEESYIPASLRSYITDLEDNLDHNQQNFMARASNENKTEKPTKHTRGQPERHASPHQDSAPSTSSAQAKQKKVKKYSPLAKPSSKFDASRSELLQSQKKTTRGCSIARFEPPRKIPKRADDEDDDDL